MKRIIISSLLLLTLLIAFLPNNQTTLYALVNADLESVRLYEHNPNRNGYKPPYRETTITEGEWFEAYRAFFYKQGITLYEVDQPVMYMGLPSDEDTLPPRIYFELEPNEQGILFVWLELCGDGTAYYMVGSDAFSVYKGDGKLYKLRLPNTYLFDAQAIKEFVDESGLAVTPY